MKPPKLVSLLLALIAGHALSVNQLALSQNKKCGIISIPERVVAFTVGTVIGAPIAVIRSTKRQIVAQTKEAYTLGGLYPPFGWVTAGFFGIPSGILCGAGFGLGDAVVNGFENSKDAPFSKASFSLEKLDW